MVGRPFQKGQSGNPGGAPKGAGYVRALARKQTEEAIKTLVEIMGNAKVAPKARVAAAQVLLDRGYGRPQQPVKHSGNIGLGTYLAALSRELAAVSVESEPEGVRH